MLGSLREQLFVYGPMVASNLAIVIVGLVLSALAKRFVRTIVKRSGLEAVSEGAGIAPFLYLIGARQGLASFLGTCAMWAGLLGTFAVVCERLGIDLVRVVIASFLGYLPRLAVALSIAFGSIVVGSIVQRAVVRIGSSRADLDSPGPLGSAARGLVIFVGITLAAEQAGLEIRFLTTLFEVVVGVGCVTLGLAFALGFYVVVRGMAARHYYKALVRPGDHITIGADQGTVVRFGATAVVLRDEGKERIVPCVRMLTNTVVVATNERASDSSRER